MKRSIILFPLFVVALGSLTLPLNKSYEKVSAVDEGIIADGEYFIINDNDSYGLKYSSNEINNSEAYAYLAKPFMFTHQGNNVYHITQNGYTVVRQKGSTGNVLFKNDGTGYPDWTISNASDGYFYLDCTNDTDTRRFNYYVSSNSYFEVRRTNSSDLKHPNIKLLSVNEGISSFVTAMQNIPCNNPTEEQRKDAWNLAKEAYDNLTDSPNKRALQYVTADKDADINTVAWAMSKYDYVRNKYGYDGDDNFLNRSDVDYHVFDQGSNSLSYSNSMNIIAVVVVSITVLSSLLLVNFIKKKQK